MGSGAFLMTEPGQEKASRTGVTLLLRGGAVVGAGLVIELGSLFLRTLILARLLGATEFGVVVSINTLAALASMFSFIGVDRYIIYAPDGGEAEALAVGHALSLIRGAVGAMLVLALAVPTAALINMQAYEVSFAMVAAVPLLSGATHLGTAQMQRAGRFWPAAASDAGGAVLGVAAAAIAAVVAPDHRAIIWGLAAQTGGAVVLSHCFARGRRYRISFDHRRIRETLRFGLPLLINGVALAAAYQFDRMIVGAWLGVVALGVYGLCQTLLFQPLALLQRLTTTTLQPGLSRAWHADPDQLFPTQTRHIAMLMAGLSCAIAVAAACLGAPALRLLFGASFTASDAFFVLMATALLIRMARGCLNLFGLAIGRTADLMLSNIAGSASLPMMIAAFAVYPRLESAAFAAVVGEVMGCLAAYLRLRRHCGQACRDAVRGLAAAAAPPIVAGAWILLVHPSIWMRGTAVTIACAGACAVMVLQMPWVRRGISLPAS